MNRRSSHESKDRILGAALKLFSEHGYQRTGMRTIAQSAGISVGGLYLYFRNKEDLCLTMIKDRLDDLSKELTDGIGSERDPVRALQAYIRIHLDYARRHRELILAQSREFGFEFGLETKQAFFTKQRKTITHLIRTGVRQGVFGHCDVKEATKIITGILRGFILSIVVDPDNLFSTDECSRLIMRGLLARAQQ
jgi:AcrR family transcriptional regulator